MPSIAGSVFAALDYLTSYPYGCTEQTMSSFLPDVLVADALKKLGVKSNIDPATLNKQVQAGLDRLYNYQHDDGGWGWWQTDDSHPFMTAYVLAGLSQAKAAGFDVKQDAIDKGRAWLLPEFNKSTKVRTDLRAYMAYALVLSGSDSNAQVIDSVWSQRSTLTAYGKAVLGLAMLAVNDSRAKDLTTQLEGEAKQDDSQAWWPSDQNYLMDYAGDTTPQSTAYALKLINHTDPTSPLIPKAAVYLVSHRSDAYYWDSTEQTAMVIYGLTDYLERTQELKPNYSVDIEVNGKSVATKKFTADDALAAATTVTLNESQLTAQGENRGTHREEGRWAALLVDARRVLLEREEGRERRHLPAEHGAPVLQADFDAEEREDRLPPRSALWAGAGWRHARGAHHRRRQCVELPDDRGPDSVGHGIDRA